MMRAIRCLIAACLLLALSESHATSSVARSLSVKLRPEEKLMAATLVSKQQHIPIRGYSFELINAFGTGIFPSGENQHLLNFGLYHIHLKNDGNYRLYVARQLLIAQTNGYSFISKLERGMRLLNSHETLSQVINEAMKQQTENDGESCAIYELSPVVGSVVILPNDANKQQFKKALFDALEYDQINDGIRRLNSILAKNGALSALQQEKLEWLRIIRLMIESLGANLDTYLRTQSNIP